MNKEFSHKLSECLDYMGYSLDRIHRRRDMNQVLDEIYNQKGFAATCITTGGKGEGNALYFESDIDRMFVLNDVECIRPGERYSCSTVFHLDMSDSDPGYTRLKLFRPDKEMCVKEIENFLEVENNKNYISNTFTFYEQQAYCIDINGHHAIKSGKKCGQATSYGNKNIKYDIVPAFASFSADLKRDWTVRERLFDWPPKDVIDEISKLEVHVVPVANKTSKHPGTEWRISYTRAELCLMRALTESQSKLYVLLKFVSRATLRPRCEKLSSYILKNVLFWMFESNPVSYFTLDTLMDRLVESLELVKDHLSSNKLRCYMIAGRNLLRGRITDEERKDIIEQLDILLKDKETIIHQCPKLKNALQKQNNSPEDMRKEKIKREHIEDLLFKKNIIFKHAESVATETVSGIVWKFEPNLEENEEYQMICKEIERTVIPNDLDVNEEEEVIEKLSAILS